MYFMKELQHILLACMLLSSIVATSQSTNQGAKKYSTKEFFSSKKDFQSARFQSDYYINVRFNNSLNLKNQNALNDAGIKLIKSTGTNEYLIALNKAVKKSTLEQYGVTTIELPSVEEKLSTAVKNIEIPSWAAKGSDRAKVSVLFNDGIRPEQISDILEGYDAPINEKENFQGFIQSTELYLDQILDLATHPLVAYVDFIQEPDQKLNFENRSILKVNRVQRDIPGQLNLFGEGVCIGIGDGGELGEHLDFTQRVTNKAEGTYSSFGAHGDHVSGIVGGEGLINPWHRGMAPEAKLITQKTSLITYNLEEYYEQCGMVLTNNSYGTSANCSSNGSYNYTSHGLDHQLNQFTDVLHVFAAGNSGGMSCDGYPVGYKTVLKFYQSAKNVLTVGNLKEDREINSNSSRGPVLDGRLKPEVVAVGSAVYSTGREFNYYASSGTSMAAPAVTGVLGLMYEQYRLENNQENPEGALMKAIIANTAEDLGNPGPDFTYGFGLVNAYHAVNAITEKNYFDGTLANAESQNTTINVPANVGQLKIMLYWSDVEAELDAPIALVNDLDISVNAPDGNYLPWVLDHTPANVALDAIRGVDRLNNVEQVTIDNPVAGNYNINVAAYNIPIGTQKYWVTYEFVSKEIALSYPLGGEALAPEKQIIVEWESDKTASSEFKLEWSANNGASWQLVKNNIASDKRYYKWTLPETATEQAKIRVTRLSDNTVISSDAFSIIGAPEDFTVSPGCAHTVDLNWDEVELASSYIVYEITSDGIKQIESSSENSATLGGEYTPGEEYWFAVQAVTANGVKGPRSNAESGTVVSGIICPWDNDMVAYTPVRMTARKGTKDAFGPLTPVTIVVANAGANDINEFNLSYRINNGEKVTETFSEFIASGDSLSITFEQTADLSQAGEYMIETWVEVPGDTHTENDYLPAVPFANLLENDPIEVPFTENFANVTGAYTGNFFAINGREHIDINTGISGEVNFTKIASRNSMSLKPLSLWQEGVTYSESILTLNMEGHFRNSDPVLFSMEYIGHSQILALGWDSNGNFIQVRGSDEDPWITIHQFEYKSVWSELNGIDISQAMIDADQHFSSSFQIRIVQDALFGLAISEMGITTASRLPVDWGDFDVRGNENGNVDVKWTTESEFENQHFGSTGSQYQ